MEKEKNELQMISSNLLKQWLLIITCSLLLSGTFLPMFYFGLPFSIASWVHSVLFWLALAIFVLFSYELIIYKRKIISIIFKGVAFGWLIGGLVSGISLVIFFLFLGFSGELTNPPAALGYAILVIPFTVIVGALLGAMVGGFIGGLVKGYRFVQIEKNRNQK